MLVNIKCIFVILFCGLWKADGLLTRNVRPLGKRALCVPKTRWFEQCNWCVCSVDGNVKTCTDVICIRDDMTPIPIHPAIVRRHASGDNNNKSRFLRKGSKATVARGSEESKLRREDMERESFKLKKQSKLSNKKEKKYKLDRPFVSNANSEAV